MRSGDVNRAALRHRLTGAEKEAFDRDGFLVVPSALTARSTAALLAAADRVHRRAMAGGTSGTTRFEQRDILVEDPAFEDLVDHPRTLAKVWGIMGWNICLYYTNLAVSPPTGQARRDGTFGFHQDSGQVNRDLETHPRPRLSLKVIYCLTDLTGEGAGNTWVIPGSHLRNELELPRGRSGQPPGARPLLVEPGTAVLLDRRTWHASTPNWSGRTRVVLFYGYAHRWIRPKGEHTVAPLLPRADPVRRQLLGVLDDPNSPYEPGPDGPPLRAWLREHSPAEAV